MIGQNDQDSLILTTKCANQPEGEYDESIEEIHNHKAKTFLHLLVHSRKELLKSTSLQGS